MKIINLMRLMQTKRIMAIPQITIQKFSAVTVLVQIVATAQIQIYFRSSFRGIDLTTTMMMMMKMARITIIKAKKGKLKQKTIMIIILIITKMIRMTIMLMMIMMVIMIRMRNRMRNRIIDRFRKKRKSHQKMKYNKRYIKAVKQINTYRIQIINRSKLLRMKRRKFRQKQKRSEK